MADVLRASVELPTIIFTALLAILACLWLLSLVGVLDVEADSADGLLDDALEPLNLSEVPTTILLTIIGLAGWFVSVLASVFLLDSRSGIALVVLAIIVGVGAAIFALGFTMWIAPKLAQIFVTETAPSKRDLLGRIAEVRSATVTESSGWGEATWPDGTVSTVDIRKAEQLEREETTRRTVDADKAGSRWNGTGPKRRRVNNRRSVRSRRRPTPRPS